MFQQSLLQFIITCKTLHWHHISVAPLYKDATFLISVATLLPPAAGCVWQDKTNFLFSLSSASTHWRPLSYRPPWFSSPSTNNQFVFTQFTSESFRLSCGGSATQGLLIGLGSPRAVQDQRDDHGSREQAERHGDGHRPPTVLRVLLWKIKGQSHVKTPNTSSLFSDYVLLHILLLRT